MCAAWMNPNHGGPFLTIWNSERKGARIEIRKQRREITLHIKCFKERADLGDEFLAAGKEGGSSAAAGGRWKSRSGRRGGGRTPNPAGGQEGGASGRGAIHEKVVRGEGPETAGVVRRRGEEIAGERDKERVDNLKGRQAGIGQAGNERRGRRRSYLTRDGGKKATRGGTGREIETGDRAWEKVAGCWVDGAGSGRRTVGGCRGGAKRSGEACDGGGDCALHTQNDEEFQGKDELRGGSYRAEALTYLDGQKEGGEKGRKGSGRGAVRCGGGEDHVTTMSRTQEINGGWGWGQFGARIAVPPTSPISSTELCAVEVSNENVVHETGGVESRASQWLLLIEHASPCTALDVLLEQAVRLSFHAIRGQEAACRGAVKIMGELGRKRGDEGFKVFASSRDKLIATLIPERQCCVWRIDFGTGILLLGENAGVSRTRSHFGHVWMRAYHIDLSIFKHEAVHISSEAAIGIMSLNIQASSSSTPSFQPIFEKALEEYKKKTGNDLTAHPLAAEINSCDSPESILIVLQGKANELNQSRSSDDRLTKWLNPTVNILNALSATLGDTAGSVFPPTKIIFSGIGILLVAAKSTVANRDVLVKLFDRIESFFERLRIYTNVPPSPAMTDELAKIMAEVLSILAIATKGMKEKRIKTFFKKVAGMNGLEDALQRFGELEQRELLTGIAQVSSDTNVLKDGV
ncbi:hypothetical protein EDB85DRAFT_2274618 [Lactarius pseudohatsudake]|nr:hypothetical protein EDB85DRAFT_2274618 [Lactarius pseudohatsudake]